MLINCRTRYTIPLLVLACYMIPIILLVLLSLLGLELDKWTETALTLLLASLGSIALYTAIAEWEKSVSTPTIEPTPTVEHDDIELLESQITEKNNEIQNLLETHAEYEEEVQKTMSSLAEEKLQLENEITHRENLFESSEQTILELRSIADKRQQRTTELETKVRDLSYEIKTLLKIAESGEELKADSLTTPENPPVTPPCEPAYILPDEKDQLSREDATTQLKRSIDTAQKMTGASHYSTPSPQSRTLPIDNYVLDLRCLFDSFRSETSCAILFYSPKEDKILFANDHTKELTGWSPEKFMQNYDHIVQNGREELKNAAHQLSVQSQTKIRLVTKTRTGEDRLLYGLLGMIPTGIFRNHIVIILYSAEHQHALSNTH